VDVAADEKWKFHVYSKERLILCCFRHAWPNLSYAATDYLSFLRMMNEHFHTNILYFRQCQEERLICKLCSWKNFIIRCSEKYSRRHLCRRRRRYENNSFIIAERVLFKLWKAIKGEGGIVKEANEVLELPSLQLW
jgi:hypothetical protein